MRILGNLKRFLNRDPWSQRRLYLCHISDNLFHTFLHSPSFPGHCPCLINAIKLLSLFSFSSFTKIKKKQEGNVLLWWKKVYISWKLYRGCVRLTISFYIVSLPLIIRTTPLAIFHYARPCFARVASRFLSYLPISALGPAGMTRPFHREDRPTGLRTVCQ